MAHTRRAASLAAGLTLALVAWPYTALASPAAAPVAIVHAGADVVSWIPAQPYERLRLTVVGPAGWTRELRLESGQPVVLPLTDEAGLRLPDGGYTWELALEPAVDPALRAALARAREAGDAQLAASLLEGAPRGARQSGAFTVLEGQPVAPGRWEARSPLGPVPGPVPGQSIVDSLCLGFDCPASPSFSDTTLLLMENNLRLKFDDTSSAVGFANRDWSLNANDSESGGANRFFVQDCGTSAQGGCSGNAVFTIEGGARSNALYVDDGGRIGVGTSTPLMMLHLKYGNSPGLRLEQDTTYGWSAQSWDLGGNEANWFVRDVTSGSRMPLRIRPGAPTDSLHVYGDGKVGLGTGTPSASLHVKGSVGSALFQIEETSATTAARNMLKVVNNGAATIRLDNTAAGGYWGFGSTSANNFFVSHSSSGILNLTLTSAGVLTVTDLVETSDRDLKQEIEPVDGRELLERLAVLPIATWRFRDGQARHIGPMAQDFWAGFGLGPDDRHIRPGDLAGVALAVAQQLSRSLADKEARLAAQESRLAELAAQVATLSAALSQAAR